MTEWIIILIAVVAFPLWVSVSAELKAPKAQRIKRKIEAGGGYTYDPSEDPDKIMRGETESYFD